MKKQQNFLDFIPVINPENSWEDRNGTVTVLWAHRGVWDRAAQRLFHTPKISRLELDVCGSFLWRQMDGRRTVGQLAQMMSARFGGEAEPLYGRLVPYLQILGDHRLILFQRPS